MGLHRPELDGADCNEDAPRLRHLQAGSELHRPELDGADCNREPASLDASKPSTYGVSQIEFCSKPASVCETCSLLRPTLVTLTCNSCNQTQPGPSNRSSGYVHGRVQEHTSGYEASPELCNRHIKQAQVESVVYGGCADHEHRRGQLYPRKRSAGVIRAVRVRIEFRPPAA